MRYREAIGQATLDAMTDDPAVLVLGAGVTDAKGIFGTTRPAHERFPKRFIETPLSENMLTGALVGMALAGLKPMFVHARADFSYLTFEHLINTAAKWRETHGSDKPLHLVVRMLVGRGWGQGSQHSQNVASMLAHVPGLRLFMPATPGSAYAAIREALSCGQPSIVIEQRRLYEVEGPVDTAQPFIGRHVALCKSWPDMHIIAFAGAWPDALQAQQELERLGVNAMCLCPEGWPWYAGLWQGLIRQSRHLVIVDTDWIESGLGAEMAALAVEGGIASVRRIGPPRTSCPTGSGLEAAWYPSVQGIVDAVLVILNREPIPVMANSEQRDGRKEPF